MPIRVRLAGSFAAVTLVLVAVGGLMFASSFRNGLEDSLKPGLRVQATRLAEQVQADPGGLDLRSELSNDDDVAQVLDADGRLLTSTVEAGTRPLVSSRIARRAREGRVFADAALDREREPFRVLARAVSTTDGDRIVVVGVSLEPTEAAVERVERAVVIGGLVAIAVAGVGGWALAGAALRPVERMRREAADISEHDSTATLPVPATRDEIAALATTMNALLGRLQQALVRQKAFVGDAGHELRTPLAVLKAELELAGRPQRTRADLEDAIAHAAAETERLARLADELLVLARTDESAGDAARVLPLAPLVERAVEESRATLDGGDVNVTVDADAEVRASVEPTLLARAVVNLLVNAAVQSPSGGTVSVNVRRDGDTAIIEVLDDGPGFPPDFLPHAFERFRRADDARSRADGGTGLGLAIVLAAARALGGTATAANRPDGGAVVAVRLPARV